MAECAGWPLSPDKEMCAMIQDYGHRNLQTYAVRSSASWFLDMCTIISFVLMITIIFHLLNFLCAMTQSYDTNVHDDPSGYDRQDCWCAPGILRHDTWTYKTVICVRRSKFTHASMSRLNQLWLIMYVIGSITYVICISFTCMMSLPSAEHCIAPPRRGLWYRMRTGTWVHEYMNPRDPINHVCSLTGK